MRSRREEVFVRQPKKYEVYKKLINCYRWQMLRKKKFLANPLCEDCLKEGRVTPTEEVHHVTPVERGRDEAEMRRLAYDYNNLRSLCRACHARYHAPPEKPISANAKDFFEKFLA